MVVALLYASPDGLVPVVSGHSKDVVVMLQNRSLKSNREFFALRRARPAGPHCRGGASSVLRLTQPVAPRLPNVLDLESWVSRAGDVLMQVTGPLAEYTANAELAGAR